MKNVLLARWFYDFEWNRPESDVKEIHKSNKYKDKYICIQIDVVKETDKAYYCYVNLINNDNKIIEFYCAYPTWIPKSVIKEV